MQHLLPSEAQAYLESTPDALFVDCRSNAEFFFVGHPKGAVHVAWFDGVDWEPNPHFVGEVRKLAGNSIDRPIVILCRSGRRSVDAGLALEADGFTQIFNVLHGFEGDLDDKRQRGHLNGWRHDNLPWEQT